MSDSERESPDWSHWLNWPRALGGAAIQGEFRTEPEDFVVDELAAPPLEDIGEHVYLHIRKRGANTAWVAQKLAVLAGVRTQDVGFYGLKDRHAVTTQWFSVWLGQKAEPDWQGINDEEITLLTNRRGPRKLRRGDHSGNRFTILLRNITGDRALAERVLARIVAGVPNYFGEQRFGQNGGNLDTVRALINRDSRRVPRNQKAFAMSAARSWLFNQVLAERVRTGSWQELLDGEPETDPSGPLWGRGRNRAAGALLELEQEQLQPWADWCDWLEHCGLSQERRALVLRPEAFSYRWQDDNLQLQFALPGGAFATALLREIAELVNVSGATIQSASA